MFESQYPTSFNQESSKASVDIETGDVRPLFECSAESRWVSVTAHRASKIQSLALADLWANMPHVGYFRQFVTETTSELRISGCSVDEVQGLIDGITEESIEPYVQSIKQARRTALEQDAANEALEKMSLSEFGKLLCARASSKLIAFTGPVPGERRNRSCAMFKFKAVDLLPVTHFKGLARVARYETGARAFVYSEEWGADLEKRLKLLAQADKIRRSKKKVTWEDIAVRKAKQMSRSSNPTAEQIEEYIFDVYGWGENIPEHIAAAIEALKTR